MKLKKSVPILACLLSATLAHAHPLEEHEPGEFGNKLILGAAFGAKAGLSMLRGTHSKGTCVNGEMEFKDLDEKSGLPPEVLKQLRVGLFGHKGASPFQARIRFANAEGASQDDHVYDARAVSISLNLGGGKKQDFVLQNSPVFPIPNLKDFGLLLNFVAKGKDLKKFNPEQQERIKYMQGKGKTFTADPKSYRTETYWSETAFALGDESAVKYIMRPCEANSVNPAPGLASQNDSPNYLADDLSAGVRSSGENCFDFRVQILKPEKMSLDGKKIQTSNWVENPTLAWSESESPSYSVGTLRLSQGEPQSAAQCDAFRGKVSVMSNTLPEHRGIGRINRGRELSEKSSADARSHSPMAIWRKAFGKKEKPASPSAPTAQFSYAEEPKTAAPAAEAFDYGGESNHGVNAAE